MQSIYLTIALAPLAAAIIAGLFGKWIGRVGAHTVTIAAAANGDDCGGPAAKHHHRGGPSTSLRVTEDARGDEGRC